MSACGTAPAGARHPLFIKAVKLKKEGRFQAAADTFEKCLRQSPDNRPAHVQLGMLYEDHLNDPLAALYHYRQGAPAGAEDPHAQFARHAADLLLKRLIAHYSETGSADTADAPPDAPETKVEALKEQVRELTRQRGLLLAQLKTTAARLQTVEKELNTLRDAQTPPGSTAKTPGPVTTYQVKKGDTLIGITRKHYGSPAYWQALKDYNRRELRGGDQVIPGMTLRLPPKDTLSRRTND